MSSRKPFTRAAFGSASVPRLNQSIAFLDFEFADHDVKALVSELRGPRLIKRTRPSKPPPKGSLRNIKPKKEIEATAVQ